jgi:hypothetical protein
MKLVCFRLNTEKPLNVSYKVNMCMKVFLDRKSVQTSTFNKSMIFD